MKKKLLMILVCGVLVLGMAGCGSSEEKTEHNNNSIDKSENTNKQTKDSSVNNSEIENVIDNWVKAIHIDYNSKSAYKYIDYVGVAVWQHLRLGAGEIKENNISKFLDLYNKYNNDTTLKNKVNDYVKENVTNEFYENLNKTLSSRKSTFSKYEIKDIQEVSNDIYNVYVYYEVMINNQKSSYSIEHTLIKKDNGYYFINAGALYESDILDLWSVIE